MAEAGETIATTQTSRHSTGPEIYGTKEKAEPFI